MAVKYDREKMKKGLLHQTQTSYERREGDVSTKYFKPDLVGKIWRPGPTKGNPHIIDIIPYTVGKNMPNTSDLKEGDYAYVLDLYVHSNVGPGKIMVVCPAKNYGDPCPICDEVEEALRAGAEWIDIPIVAKRRCTYNVLVMDNAQTEAEGLQLWEVSHAYFEKPITALARNPRGGGFIPFADPEKEVGKSIAFEVENDTYKKITGHRFENRDYDIPIELLDQAKVLDELIVVYNEDQIKRILYGQSGQRPENYNPIAQAQTEKDESDVPASVEQKPSLRQSLRQAEQTKMTCSYGAVFGVDFGKYEECAECTQAQSCAEAADKKDAEKTNPPAAAQKEESAQSGLRRPLSRRRE